MMIAINFSSTVHDSTAALKLQFGKMQDWNMADTKHSCFYSIKSNCLYIWTARI